MSIVGFVVAVSAAAVVGVAPAAASAMPAGGSVCWTVPAATHDESGRGLWNYVHTVAWCGDQKQITSTVPPRIEVSTIDNTCVWQGVKSQRTEFRGGSWVTHSMGEFACTGEDGTLGQVNPWMTVTVHPNGSHDAVGGVAA